MNTSREMFKLRLEVEKDSHSEKGGKDQERNSRRRKTASILS